MQRLPLVSPRLGLLAALLFASPAFLGAQDASLSALRWADPRDPPQELPVLQSKINFAFPRELAGTAEIGYVVMDLVLDGKGKVLVLHPRGTLAAFVRAATVEQGAWRFSPGRRDGKGVNTATTFAVLFNPATAAANRPDATPRLLEVDVVRVPKPPGAKENERFEDSVVWADLAVDETGRVTGAKNVPAELEEKVSVALKNWKFAPARRAGQPVATEIRAPLIVTTGEPAFADEKSVPPKAIHREAPIYPFAMRASGMRGEVMVEFVVDIEGRVKNPFAVRSLNPAFDDPAIEAVRKWRFEPGRKGDRPVVTRMQVPVVFQLNNVSEGGSDGMLKAKKADLSKLPEELRYDTPPRLSGSARPVYPFALLNAGATGRALIRFFVDERGRVIHAIVGEASAPEFGHALLAAVEQFVYEPAVKAGKPSKALLGFSQEFKTDETLQLVSASDLELLRREQKRPQTIIGPAEIDGKLVPLSRRPPQFPLSLLQKTTQGEAVIEFIVDEEGRARLPRIVSATEEAFGYAAVQGVASWRFEPPTRGGRPAAVRVKVPVRFNLATQPAEDAKN